MFTFNGSHFTTLKQAAASYAEDALPDALVSAVPAEVARETEAHWYAEAMRSQGVLALPTNGGEPALDENAWRALCRAAIEARISDALNEMAAAV